MEPDSDDLPPRRFIRLFGWSIYICPIEDSENVEEEARFKRQRSSSETTTSSTTTTTKKKNALDEDDRISGLPDELLLFILSLSTTKQSARTCILSKRWQHLWKSVPVLDFYNSLDPYFYPEESLSDIISRVDTVLALHESPKISLFRLNVIYDNVDYSSDVDNWVSFAMKKNVQELDLTLALYGDYDDADDDDDYVLSNESLYLLPDFVYDDGSWMERLSLWYCQMLPHNKLISWTSLKFLSLRKVHLTNCSIREIISGCPSIIKFGLCRCSGFDRMYIDSKSSLSELVIDGYFSGLMNGSALEICAPNIRSLDLLRKFDKLINVIDLSSLVDVKLKFYLRTRYGNNTQAYLHILKKLLRRLEHVGNLTVGTWCTKVLSVLELRGFPIPQSKCKYLTLKTSINRWVLPGISSLLKSSPDIHTLVVKMNYDSCDPFPDSDSDDEIEPDDILSDFEVENHLSSMENALACLSMSVKTIKIKCFHGEPSEIEFVQFLLTNARVLQTMIIQGWKKNSFFTETKTANSEEASQRLSSPIRAGFTTRARMKYSVPIRYRPPPPPSKAEVAATQLLSFPRSSTNAVISLS